MKNEWFLIDDWWILAFLDWFFGLLSGIFWYNKKVKDYNLLLVDEIKDRMLVNVKTRYRSHEVEAYIKEVGEYIEVELLNPQKGVTPGQSAVFYIDDIVLGGGVIVWKKLLS